MTNIVFIGDTMFGFFTILFVAVSLSMDTFSLSLSYGMLNIKKQKILKISLAVGIFHFFMPLLGNLFGEFIFKIIPIKEKNLIGIIFLIISIEIMYSLFKEKEVSPIRSFLDIILFSFTVSIDSFITGICLDVFNLNYLIIALIFMFTSFLFTFFGFYFGYYIHSKFGVIAEIIGIIILIFLAIFYLIY